MSGRACPGSIPQMRRLRPEGWGMVTQSSHQQERGGAGVRANRCPQPTGAAQPLAVSGAPAASRAPHTRETTRTAPCPLSPKPRQGKRTPVLLIACPMSRHPIDLPTSGSQTQRHIQILWGHVKIPNTHTHTCTHTPLVSSIHSLKILTQQVLGWG